MTADPAKFGFTAEFAQPFPLHCCEFVAAGRFVLAGGRDRRLVRLDVDSGRSVLLDGHSGWIAAVAAAGPDLALSTDSAGRTIAWDCRSETFAVRWSIAAHDRSVLALAVSPDGRRFATSDRLGAVQIGDTFDGRRTDELPELEHPVGALAWSSDGRRLIAAERRPKSPRITVWDVASARLVHAVDAPQLSAYRQVEDIEWGGIRALAAGADDSTVVALGCHAYAGPAAAFEFALDDGAVRRRLASPLKGFAYAARRLPLGHLVTCAGDVGQGELRVWAADRDESIAQLDTPGPCAAFDLHPDGRRFVAALMRGRGSYPDSGSLHLGAWTA